MRPVSRCLALASLLALSLVALPNGARATAAPAGVSPLKLRQMRLLAQEPMRERQERRERLAELRRLARRLRASGRTSLQARGERARPEVLDEDARLGRRPAAPGRLATPTGATGAAALPPNVRCNDPSGDLLSAGFGNTVVEGQCETSIVRWNNYMVAAWNDGKGFDDGTNQTQGYATSVDGGLTWVDHGTFPIPTAYASSWHWTSDPVLAVNPNTGAFYFSALADIGLSQSTVGVVKGSFSGTTFTWGNPSAARIVSTSTDYLDKEWIAVDPADGRVYLSYTNFPSTGSEINFQFADSALAAWSTYRKLSTTAENGWVQGSRPIVGSGGTVYLVWYRIGTVDVDYFRIARSTDRGSTFSAPNDCLSFYSNYGSGAPGFNRPMGIQFPSIAVDRSGGAHDGRLFLAWNESLNWYDDFAGAGSGGAQNEIEPNDLSSQATPATIGETLRGTLSSSSDYDYFALPMTAGQTLLAICDSLGGAVPGPNNSYSDYVTMRMFAPDGATRLAFTAFGSTDVPATWVFTAPTTATYYLRMASGHASAAPYVVRTGFATRTTERGRDQRDIFVAYSDNGGSTWSTPTLVNASAVGYDEWLPEVAVAPDGQVGCAWYDWRDATASTAGGESSIYLATSDDGGSTWTEKGAISDARTAWTSTLSNIVPNQGDYLSMFANLDGLAVAWSDGRSGNPDVYMEWIASDRPTLLLARGVPGQVDLQWYLDRTPGTTAGLYRQVGASTTWDSIATLTLDANKHFSYTDTSGIVAGGTYRYQLGIVTSGTEYFYPYATVNVAGPSLELAGMWPNPGDRKALVSFSLPSDAPATLKLIDLTGRRVFSLVVSGAGRHEVPFLQGRSVTSGVYFLQLEQGGQRVSRRVVIVD